MGKADNRFGVNKCRDVLSIQDLLSSNFHLEIVHFTNNYKEMANNTLN